MKTYTFYLHDGPDAVPVFELEMFNSQAEALAHAHTLLADRPRYDRVIVTEEVVEIARFDRPEPAAETAEERRTA
jgi:hypothetical protein